LSIAAYALKRSHDLPFVLHKKFSSYSLHLYNSTSPNKQASLSHHKIPPNSKENKHWRKWNEQPRMDNPEALATLGKQDIG
jgi:hypothetical protein